MIRRPGDQPQAVGVNTTLQDMQKLGRNPVFSRVKAQVTVIQKAVEGLLEIEAGQDHDVKTKVRLQEILTTLRAASLPPHRKKNR